MAISLDKRLKTISDFVRQDIRACDVGTDHGYLAVHLLQTKKAISVKATDINPSPLNSAKETAKKHNVPMEFILSDGLASVNVKTVDDVIIAGMGGELIARIISDAPDLKSADKHLILQPMTNVPKLRAFLYNNGFAINKEAAIIDKQHTYTVMSVTFCGESSQKDEVFLRLGKLTENADKDSKEYVKRQIIALEKEIDGLKKSKSGLLSDDKIKLLDEMRIKFDVSF